MALRICGFMISMVFLALAAVFTAGCEPNAEDPSQSTNDTTVIVQTNFVTANLQGVWNMAVSGSVRNVSGVLVLDSRGNVTWLTGPTGASGAMGSFSVGTDAVSVNGSMKYSALGSNGVSESHTIYFQGRFVSMNQMAGEDTHSWMPAMDSGYDKGTFTLNK